MIKFIDLFAGIGGIRLPFDELGYQCVFSSEWDKATADTYEANFGERPAGDITQINTESIPSHDLLLAGFPCQAFSIMGKMQGFADIRGTMFFEVARILAYHRPKAILLENVKQLTTHDKGRTVLGIWNERINIAQDNYNPVRTSILVRSNDLLSYCLFEEDSHRFRTNDYVWEANSNGNLIGKHIETEEACFAWQPHGSQFTIHTSITENAVKFTIKRPALLTKENILETLHFDSSWVKNN